MKISMVLASCLFVVFLAGCTQHTQEETVGQQSEVEDAAAGSPQKVAPAVGDEPGKVDPLVSFKEVVARLETEMAALWEHPLVWHNDGISAWLKHRIRADKFSYDVKRTESLVSPYTAELLCVFYTTHTGEWNSQGEAAASNEFEPEGSGNEMRVRYACQDGKWVVKQIQWRVADERIRSTVGEDWWDLTADGSLSGLTVYPAVHRTSTK